jgi:gas vesicle protein
MKNTMGTEMSFFFAGLALGGGVALLLAPRSGDETRAEIKERLEKGAETLRRKSDEMMAQASDMMRTGKETLLAGQNRVRSELRRMDAAVQAGKQAYQQPPAEA